MVGLANVTAAGRAGMKHPHHGEAAALRLVACARGRRPPPPAAAAAAKLCEQSEQVAIAFARERGAGAPDMQTTRVCTRAATGLARRRDAGAPMQMARVCTRAITPFQGDRLMDAGAPLAFKVRR